MPLDDSTSSSSSSSTLREDTVPNQPGRLEPSPPSSISTTDPHSVSNPPGTPPLRSSGLQDQSASDPYGFDSEPWCEEDFYLPPDRWNPYRPRTSPVALIANLLCFIKNVVWRAALITLSHIRFQLALFRLQAHTIHDYLVELWSLWFSAWQFAWVTSLLLQRWAFCQTVAVLGKILGGVVWLYDVWERRLFGQTWRRVRFARL